MIKNRKKDWYKNIIIKSGEQGKNSKCYICERDIIYTDLKVHTENKHIRNAHLSCMLNRIEQEKYSFKMRAKILNKMKKQIMEHPENLELERDMLPKQDVIFGLETWTK